MPSSDTIFQLKVENKDRIIKMEKDGVGANVFESEMMVEKSAIRIIVNDKNDTEFANPQESVINSDKFNKKKFKNTYTCKKCDQSFCTSKLFYSHFKHHCLANNKFQLVSKQKKLECDICKKRFSNQSNCRKHTEIHFHDDVNKLKCMICMKTFFGKYSLRVHSRLHTGVNPFECDVCHLTFPRKDLLLTHRRSHGKYYLEILYCPECKKPFRTSKTLMRHKITIHDKVKPYSCSECQESFARKESLVVHVRSKHSGYRPFKCYKCMKTFFEKSVLLCHMKLHNTSINDKK